MPEIQFVFTPGDSIKTFPIPISGKYELVKLTIEADETEDFKAVAAAVRSMRLYFRVDFGSTYHKLTKTVHLSNHVFLIDSVPYTIDFEEEVFNLTKVRGYTNAIASALKDVMPPITRMTLVLNHIESE